MTSKTARAARPTSPFPQWSGPVQTEYLPPTRTTSDSRRPKHRHTRPSRKINDAPFYISSASHRRLCGRFSIICSGSTLLYSTLLDCTLGRSTPLSYYHFLVDCCIPRRHTFLLLRPVCCCPFAVSNSALKRPSTPLPDSPAARLITLPFRQPLVALLFVPLPCTDPIFASAARLVALSLSIFHAIFTFRRAKVAYWTLFLHRRPPLTLQCVPGLLQI